MEILEKVPYNSEHPYYFDRGENRHYWWPSWSHPIGEIVHVSFHGRFTSCPLLLSSIFGMQDFHSYSQDDDFEIKPGVALGPPSMKVNYHALNKIGYHKRCLEVIDERMSTVEGDLLQSLKKAASIHNERLSYFQRILDNASTVA